VLNALLFLSLFMLFYSLTVGRYPEARTLKEKYLPYALSAGGALAFFIVGSILFQSPVSGFVWGVLGWFVPGWGKRAVLGKKKARLRSLARDYITSSAGLYAVGQTTPDVVRIMAARFPEPLRKEFEDMIGTLTGSPYASFPKMFENLSKKYDLKEFGAVSAILSASARAGGPAAASKGFKRLGKALRQIGKLINERVKAVMESKIAAVVTISILLAGLLLDATLFREYFQGVGRLVMDASSILVVGLIMMAVKINRSDDLC